MIPEPLLDRQGKPVPYTEAAAALLLVSLPAFSVLRSSDDSRVTVGWGVPLAAYHQAHGINFIEAVFEAYSMHWYQKPWRTPAPPPRHA
jgi:hypothetical protein